MTRPSSNPSSSPQLCHPNTSSSPPLHHQSTSSSPPLNHPTTSSSQPFYTPTTTSSPSCYHPTMSSSPPLYPPTMSEPNCDLQPDLLDLQVEEQLPSEVIMSQEAPKKNPPKKLAPKQKNIPKQQKNISSKQKTPPKQKRKTNHTACHDTSLVEWNWNMVKCPQQEGTWECGYYVAIAMFELFFQKQSNFPDNVWNDMKLRTMQHIDQWVENSVSQFTRFIYRKSSNCICIMVREKSSSSSPALSTLSSSFHHYHLLHLLPLSPLSPALFTIIIYFIFSRSLHFLPSSSTPHSRLQQQLLFFNFERKNMVFKDYMLRKQHKVDEYHNDMPLINYVEGHSLHFGRPEFVLITDVLGVIEDEVMFGNLCDEDSVPLCLILALEVIFMGRLFTCPVDDSLFGLVENLEAWNVSWGEHIWILESFERSNRWWINAPQVIPRAIGWSKKSIFKRSDCCYLFAKDSKTNTDIRPTRAEYESSWWIESNVFFEHHVPKPPVIEHHPLFQAYLSKLEKSRKRLASSFRESSSVCTRDSRLKTRRLTDRVIRELNVRVFKLETIIQVLALERNDKLGRLQFNEDLSRLRGDFVESLNILFQELVDPHDSVEDIANEYLVDEELKLCLEEEERIRSEQEKRIQQEKRLRLEEEKMLRLEEEKMLQNAEAMVSCYFVQLLMQNNMPLFYANGDKYGIPWSDVDQVFILINETDQHWCLAHLDILSGLVTFYDSGDTYDYEWRDWTVADTYAMCQQLHVHCHERREQMLEMQSFLHVSTSLAESYKLLEELQNFELRKCRDLMKSISETQLKERLPVILEGAKVFDNKDVEDPVDVALAYREKMVRLFFCHKVDKCAADLRAHDLIG
ncbi:phospholipase-like protein [Tanacetum coccineum]